MTDKRFECGAMKQGTAGGHYPGDCNWPFCGCDALASRVVETLQEMGWHPPAIPVKWPQLCHLCNTMMQDPDDRMAWHGLGNCVEICLRCTGSGEEPEYGEEWIVVSKLLPKPNTLVLVSNPEWAEPFPKVMHGHIDSAGLWCGHYTSLLDCGKVGQTGLPTADPTYWQPVPKPPKAEPKGDREK